MSPFFIPFDPMPCNCHTLCPRLKNIYSQVPVHSVCLPWLMLRLVTPEKDKVIKFLRMKTSKMYVQNGIFASNRYIETRANSRTFQQFSTQNILLQLNIALIARIKQSLWIFFQRGSTIVNGRKSLVYVITILWSFPRLVAIITIVKTVKA